MVAYNFKARFAEAVERGVKRQTIRATREGRSRHARPGEPVQLYVGLRTKDARKLVDPDPICTLSTYCNIHATGVTLGNHPTIDLDEFARRDGFKDFADMKTWFAENHGLPFIGRLIAWDMSTATGTAR